MEALAERREEVAGCAHQSEEAVRTPSPVTDDRVDEAGNADRVDKVADEAGAADHGARRDRRAGVSESELEDPDREERNAGGFIRSGRALQEEPVVTDEAVALAEHE